MGPVEDLQTVLMLLNLPPHNLKNCRCVCKAWSAAALPLLLDKTTIDFTDKMEKSTFFDIVMKLNLENFIPPKNIRFWMEDELSFKELRNQTSIINSNVLYTHLLLPYGSMIQKLEILSWSNVTPISSRKLLMNILAIPYQLKELSLPPIPEGVSNFSTPWPTLPCLKTLEMSGAIGICLSDLRELFDSCTNLNTFKVRDGSAKFIGTLTKCFKNLPLSQLTHLAIRDFLLPKSGCVLPETLQFYVTSLILIGCDPSSDWISGMLNACSSTVKELQIQCSTSNNGEQLATLGSKPMASMKTIEIGEWNRDASVWNLDFMNINLPKLEKLMLKGKHSDLKENSDRGKPKKHTVVIKANDITGWCIGMKTLVLPDLKNILYDPESFTAFITRLTNLQRIELSATNMSLKCIIWNLPNLHVLKLSPGSTVNDNGMTGLKTSTMIEIESGYFNPSAEGKYRRDGIAALTKLCELVLHGKYGEITNRSITYGINKLQNLKMVTFYNCSVTKSGLMAMSNVDAKLLIN